MNPDTQDPRASVLSQPTQALSLHDSNRCHYRYANGKRCRLPSSKPHSEFCSRHFVPSKPSSPAESYSDSRDLSSDLFPELSHLSRAIDLRQFLVRLLALVTQGRISPRRAAVLSRIANQLLYSHKPKRD
jgi:hypothetical protein